ncbi:MAG TPA: MBOAT family O-acyltransferase, partial [Planctomycetota bacterium]|nr:MBOAT family O-acyltransferase [Planctomycetota bacterium]
LLPVGISFYTFQTLSYTIDLYHRRIEHERSFIKFAVYVAFFPQLVAGPIVRAFEFLPQMHSTPNVTRARVDDGLRLMFQGLVKKVVLADTLATLGVDAVFANPRAFSSWDLLFGLYGYAFQIYCDFSGYSDIAIGAARVLGYELTPNFNRPYLSQNVREFWTRWHITLSQWLRDYLYVPLGGNRKGRERTYANLMITMLLGGLWHGAAWTFAAWGLWHGFGLALERMLGLNESRRDRPAALQVPVRVLRIVLVWCFVTSGWVFFRARDFDTAWTILGTMWISPWTQGFGAWVDWRYTILLPLVFLPHAFQVMHEWYGWQKGRSGRVAIVIVSLLLLTFLRRIINQAFIYFQF